MRNMSFRVKLPLMISLLVCIVLAVTAVVSYTVAAVITLDKSKDEIKATSDRVGQVVCFTKFGRTIHLFDHNTSDLPGFAGDSEYGWTGR